MSDYDIVMPFVDGSSSYVNGYECGAIAEKMEHGEVFESRLVHTANIEQLKMLAKRQHYTVTFDIFDQTWTGMTGQRTSAN
jgi:hypothetical protein